MNNTLIEPTINTNQVENQIGELNNNSEMPGAITSHIGTGQNAKDSFIWMSITWSFYIATGLSLLIYARSFFDISSKEILLDSILTIWNIFVPIITLALGYAFGKGK